MRCRRHLSDRLPPTPCADVGGRGTESIPAASFAPPGSGPPTECELQSGGFFTAIDTRPGRFSPEGSKNITSGQHPDTTGNTWQSNRLLTVSAPRHPPATRHSRAGVNPGNRPNPRHPVAGPHQGITMRRTLRPLLFPRRYRASAPGIHPRLSPRNQTESLVKNPLKSTMQMAPLVPLNKK